MLPTLALIMRSFNLSIITTCWLQKFHLPYSRHEQGKSLWRPRPFFVPGWKHVYFCCKVGQPASSGHSRNFHVGLIFQPKGSCTVQTFWKLQSNLINDLQVSTAFVTTASHLVSKCITRLDLRCTLNAPACSTLCLFRAECDLCVCVCVCVCVCAGRNCVTLGDKFGPRVGSCLVSVKIISVLS